jgi:hypothetical protein
MEDNTYNGWKNRETWNVALWISNDESIYHFAKECADYKTFAMLMRSSVAGNYAFRSMAYATPDGVSWTDSALDIPRLNEMIADL